MLTRVGECPVCLEEKAVVTLDPCGHGICAGCLHLLLQKEHLCPMCRGTMLSCVPALVEHSDVHTRKVLLSRSVGESYGCTLRCSGNAGAAVSHVDDASSAARCGLAAGNLIVAVNGFPCYNKNVVVAMLTSTCLANVYVIDEHGVLNKRSVECSRRSGRWWRWF